MMKLEAYASFNRSGEFRNESGHLCRGSLDELYQALGIDYPKFYKMNDLSKLGILLAYELMKRSGYQGAETALFAWNRSSSYTADMRHMEHMRQGVPGPANFIYTLPNIVLGEITIRHGLRGENGFFIRNGFSAKEMLETLKLTFRFGTATNIIAGWLESGKGGNTGFLCRVVPVEEGSENLEETLKRIYESLLL